MAKGRIVKLQTLLCLRQRIRLNDHRLADNWEKLVPRFWETSQQAGESVT